MKIVNFYNLNNIVKMFNSSKIDRNIFIYKIYIFGGGFFILFFLNLFVFFWLISEIKLFIGVIVFIYKKIKFEIM